MKKLVQNIDIAVPLMMIFMIVIIALSVKQVYG